MNGRRGKEANGNSRRLDDPQVLVREKAPSTEEHGWRHSYGSLPFLLGVEELSNERCMRHSPLNSHRVYTRLTASEVNDALQEAVEKTSSKSSKDTQCEED